MRETPTRRQDTFLAEYARNGNATLSAKLAGYSPRSARVTGHRLLTNAALQQRLREAGQQGLETLLDVATNGKNEIARVRAAEILMERAYGKPVGPPQNNKPSITINFNRVAVETRDNPVTAIQA